MRQRIHRVLITLSLAAATGAAMAQTPRTMLILDGSGSMWGQIQGTPKIDIARRAIRGMLADWPEDRELGLMVYGHRSEGDCTDIETLLAPTPPDPDVFDALLADIQPRGKTPLTAAVGEAATALSHEDTPATVILVSDGRETCDADPCEAAATLARTGTDFTAHVIGFDVNAPEDQAQLRCLAENTGGTFRTASDAAGLKDALVEVTAAAAPAPEPEVIVREVHVPIAPAEPMAEAPEPVAAAEPEPVPEVAPEPEPDRRPIRRPRSQPDRHEATLDRMNDCGDDPLCGLD